MRIQVAAGILRDGAGRVLLAERYNDPQFKNLWEFPGGKVEPSESAGRALCRELEEELGVAIVKFEPLVSVDYDYGVKLVHVEFFLVTEWQPDVRAMDGQALKWALPEQITKEELLPANAAVLDLLRLL